MKMKCSRDTTIAASFDPNAYKGVARFQSIHAVRESPGRCSRKLWHRPEYVRPIEYKGIRGNGRTTQFCSQSVEVVARINKKVCVTLQGRIVGRTESFFSQLRIFAKKRR